MKKFALISTIGLALSGMTINASAANLWDVYQQALKSDPTFQIAIANQREAAESVPQSVASLLPHIGFTGNSGLSKQTIYSKGASSSFPYGGIGSFEQTHRSRSIGYQLSLTQSVLNFAYWTQLKSAKNSVKSAIATYNAAEQNVIIRSASAYFAVLQSQEILRFVKAEQHAFHQEYIRAKQSFDVGLATITDVYDAKAAYDGAIAQAIAAENDVANAKEDLRAITGKSYSSLDSLKMDFPLITPTPLDINQWVNTAVQQNWSLASAQYNTLSTHTNIATARSQHLPTLELQAGYGNQYTRTFGEGNHRTKGTSAELNLNVPLFEGGAITSQTRTAIAKYEAASATQEQIYRETVNATRKAYLAVLATISKIKADQQAIISNESSLRGMQEGYKVGTRTIVDVLNAQTKLYNAQKNYTSDRYNYIINSLTLKQAAGTLSGDDLHIINNCLTNEITPVSTTTSKPKQKPIKHKVKTQKKLNKIHDGKKQTMPPTYLQVGAYRNKKNAVNMKRYLGEQIKVTAHISTIQSKGKALYLVRIGPITDPEKLKAITEKLQSS